MPLESGVGGGLVSGLTVMVVVEDTLERLRAQWFGRKKENTEEGSEKCCLSNAGIYLLVGRIKWRRRQWHPTPVLLPGKSHGWRSLVGCSPWGR